MIFTSVPLLLDAIAYSYIISAIACFLIIVYDIFVKGNRQVMQIMNYVWPITSLYLNAFGLWAYRDMGRADSMNMKEMKGMNKMPVQEHMQHMHKTKPFWKSIFVSATHCGAGCEIGDFIGEWGVFIALSGFAIAGSVLFSEYVVDFIFAYALGIMFQYIPIYSNKTG